MSKVLIFTFTVIILICGVGIGDYTHVNLRAEEAPVSDKDLTNSLPDPNRHSFDAQGQEYTAIGQPVTPAPKKACTN